MNNPNNNKPIYCQYCTAQITNIQCKTEVVCHACGHFYTVKNDGESDYLVIHPISEHLENKLIYGYNKTTDLMWVERDGEKILVQKCVPMRPGIPYWYIVPTEKI